MALTQYMKLPYRARATGDTEVYLLPEVKAILAVLAEPARTLVATAAFTGLRRGELSAMRWENWQPGAYAVNGSVWNARVDTTKTEGSAALIPVVPYLEQLWREHHQRVGKPRAGWMFATARNTPEWPENVVSRAIKPVLDRCVVCGKGKVECDDEKAGKIESRVEHDYHRDAKLPEWRGWHASQGELQCRNISW